MEINFVFFGQRIFSILVTFTFC